MKFSYLILFLLIGTVGMFAQADGLPANAEAGKCYVKCVTPDEFRDVNETIVTKPAYKTIAIVPAVYKDVTETVVIKEATMRYEYVPAVYETIEVPYVEKEARTDLSPVSATFTNDSEAREMYPKVSRFEYSAYPDCASPNPNDCQVLCWKEYPAVNNTFPVMRLALNANTSNVPVAEIGATYRKKVVKEAAKYVAVDVPQVTGTITRKVLVTPAQRVEKVVPQETMTITKTELVKKGGITVWEEIECKLVTPTILPVYYDYNSAGLRAASKTVIDTTVLALMKDMPNIKVQIGSHTDSRGKDDYNQRLSQRRAESVVNYLVDNGISRNRLVAKGYGETKLQNKCSNGVECTETQHQMNRRTDFQVLNQ